MVSKKSIPIRAIEITHKKAYRSYLLDASLSLRRIEEFAESQRLQSFSDRSRGLDSEGRQSSGVIG
jgi:hypothetical protein